MVMEQAFTAAAMLRAVSATTPLVDASIRYFVCYALVIKTVLESLKFWQGESSYLRDVML